MNKNNIYYKPGIFVNVLLEISTGSHIGLHIYRHTDTQTHEYTDTQTLPLSPPHTQKSIIYINDVKMI